MIVKLCRYLLTQGKLSVGPSTSYLGLQSGASRLITSKDNPIIYEENGTVPPFEGFTAEDSKHLEGHPASYFATADHTHNQYALAIHNHTISEILGLEAELSNLENAILNPTLTGQQEILVGAIDVRTSYGSISYSMNLPTPTHPWENMSFEITSFTNESVGNAYITSGNKVCISLGGAGADIIITLDAAGTTINCETDRTYKGAGSYLMAVSLKFYGTYR